MEIRLKSGTNRDGASREQLWINGKIAESAYPLYECPEDATLEGNMISCSDIIHYMKVAFEAGEAKEHFDVFNEEWED